MPIDKEAALREIDAVVSEIENAPTETGGGTRDVTLYRACIARFSIPGSAYAQQAASAGDADQYSETLHLKGILGALRRDIAGDRLRTFTELVHAAVFADLLAAAEHFAESGYLMPAAVMAGGTLEEHLRQLATKHGIAATLTTANGRTKPKEASTLNDELCAHAKAFLQTDQAQNQAWLHIRNMAAHNKPEFAQVTAPQIAAMIDGVRGFISRHPA